MDAVSTPNLESVARCLTGEGYALAVALETAMEQVYTAYAHEPTPVRSLRERVPLHAVANFGVALAKALRMRARTGPRHVPP